MISRKNNSDNESAVSVIVGTLALIAVVVAGSIGIAMIMGSFSTDVSKHASPDQSVAAAQTPVYIAGSDNMDILTRSLAESYTEENPGVRIISGVISPNGVYPAMISKTIDIGALAGPISYSDITKNPNIQKKQIGLSAVVIITNRSGSYHAVSPSYGELQNFFTGTPGGVLAGATPVIRSDDCGTADTFYNKFLGSPTVTSLAVGRAEESDADLISYVAASPDAVGFADYGDVATAITDNGVEVSILSVQDAYHNYPANNMTYDNLKTTAKFNYLSTQRHADGSFVWTGNQTAVPQYNLSLMYPLYYVTKDKPNTLQKSILDYATSPAARPAFMRASAFSVADF